MPTNHQSEEAVAEKQTRKAHKKAKKQFFLKREPKTSNTASEKQTRNQQKQKQKEEKRNAKKPRRRLFPIWMRIIVVLLLCAIALIMGLMIGFGVVGDGVWEDVLKRETWQHIIDIVKKEK